MAAAHGLPEVSIARNTSEDLRLSSNSIWLAATSPLALSRSAYRRFIASSIDRSAPPENASLPTAQQARRLSLIRLSRGRNVGSGKGAPRAVPTILFGPCFGGPASLCPP